MMNTQIEDAYHRSSANLSERPQISVYIDIFGQFELCVNRNLNHKDTIEDVINEWSTRLKVPCIKDFPYGHGVKNCVLPIGANIRLDVDKKSVAINFSRLYE